MIRLVKGISYSYKGITYYNGQEARLQPDIEEYLVRTGHFEYSGHPNMIFVKANETKDLSFFDMKYKLVKDGIIEVPQAIGYKLIGLGFCKEIALRNIIAEDVDKIKNTLYIRDGGMGDIIMLKNAFNYFIDYKKLVNKINIIVDDRYSIFFKYDNRFNCFNLSQYSQIGCKFNYKLDLRMSVEGQYDQNAINRFVLFVRLLGADVKLSEIDNMKLLSKYSKLNWEQTQTKFDNQIIPRSIVVNISTSRPERNLPKDSVIGFIDMISNNNTIGNIFIVGDKLFDYKFLNTKVINATAITTIQELTNLVYKTDFYFGLDTGTSHIAGSASKKGLVIGGPINLKLRFEQYEKLRLLQQKTDCVNTLVCYRCIKESNPNLPGHCMRFNSNTLYSEFMEAIK